MMNTQNKQHTLILLILLSLCLLLVGVGGFYGGIAMLGDPNGSPMGMPVSDLKWTPFQSYFIPGLILILVWGCGSLLILASLWRRPQFAMLDGISQRMHEHWAWGLTILLGLALIIWLTVQVITLPAVAPIQYVMYSLSILIMAIPLLPQMRQHYRIS